MADEVTRNLASITEELTAPAVTELTDAEVEAVAGGFLSRSPEIAAVAR